MYVCVMIQQIKSHGWSGGTGPVRHLPGQAIGTEDASVPAHFLPRLSPIQCPGEAADTQFVRQSRQTFQLPHLPTENQIGKRPGILERTPDKQVHRFSACRPREEFPDIFTDE